MVLKTIMDKMNEINRKVEGLHLESMQAVNATQDYAEHVEAAMKVRCAHRAARAQGVGCASGRSRLIYVSLRLAGSRRGGMLHMVLYMVLYMVRGRCSARRRRRPA